MSSRPRFPEELGTNTEIVATAGGSTGVVANIEDSVTLWRNRAFIWQNLEPEIKVEALRRAHFAHILKSINPDLRVSVHTLGSKATIDRAVQVPDLRLPSTSFLQIREMEVVNGNTKFGAEKLENGKLGTEKRGTEKLSPEKLGTEKLGTEKLSPEKLSTEKLGTEKLSPEKLSTEKLGTGKLGTEKLGTEKLGTEKLGTEKIGTEKLGAEELGTEKLGTEKLGTEELGTEKIGTEKIGTEKLGTEKLETEKLGTEKLGAEKLETEKLGTEKLGTEKLETEKLETEKLGAEKLGTEKLETEKLGTEKLGAEKLGTEKLGTEKLGTENLAKKLKSENVVNDKLGIIKEEEGVKGGVVVLVPKLKNSLERRFGWFRCDTCVRSWTSRSVFCHAGTEEVFIKQTCNRCNTIIDPYKTQLNSPTSNNAKHQRPQQKTQYNKKRRIRNKKKQKSVKADADASSSTSGVGTGSSEGFGVGTGSSEGSGVGTGSTEGSGVGTGSTEGSEVEESKPLSGGSKNLKVIMEEKVEAASDDVTQTSGGKTDNNGDVTIAGVGVKMENCSGNEKEGTSGADDVQQQNADSEEIISSKDHSADGSTKVKDHKEVCPQRGSSVIVGPEETTAPKPNDEYSSDNLVETSEESTSKVDGSSSADLPEGSTESSACKEASSDSKSSDTDESKPIEGSTSCESSTSRVGPEGSEGSDGSFEISKDEDSPDKMKIIKRSCESQVCII